MQFGSVPLDHAEGAILAHSVALPMAGRSLRKGKCLLAADIAALQAEGVASVIVARLAADDMHEDAAALQIAQVVAPPGAGLRLGAAATGRVNIHTTAPGVLCIDTAAIQALNRVNPLLTLASVPPYQRLMADDMAATVKIIAYGVPAADVVQAAAVAQGALRLAQPIYATATLIETTTDGTQPAAKGRDALRARLSRLGLTLSERVVVAHRTDAIAAALLAAPGEVRFVLTASATSDPMDVAPSGLRAAGGHVTRFGMPVDPGNLLFFGDLAGHPVIGLPGCARSPALNGADWVMERLICGLPLTSDDIAAMGVGGLLKEIPIRPRLRDAQDRA